MMIDELETIKACNEALDQIADGDMDGAVMTISTLRADNQKKVDEFDKWAEVESKRHEEIKIDIDKTAGEWTEHQDWQEGTTDTDGQNFK